MTDFRRAMPRLRRWRERHRRLAAIARLERAAQYLRAVRISSAVCRHCEMAGAHEASLLLHRAWAEAVGALAREFPEVFP